MKFKLTLVVTLAASLVPLVGTQSALAQASPEAVVAERGPHHRVWERIITETRPDGTVAERVSSYTELATGLHFWKDNQWMESKEEIEIFQGAAAARQGPHQVIFAAQLNSPGAIDLLSPDGKRFRSHLLGIAYTDAASGRSVMIANAKDSIGAVLPPNQVIYQDAFAGDCVADVRFTYTKSSFEQDIIILTAPPSPAEWNMNPETTRLEVFTEFIELPEGTASPVMLKQESDPVRRQQMAEPDLIDQRLDFGVMKFEQGQAFPLGEADPFSGAAVQTGKSMERIDGRVVLIEKVDYRDIREQLGRLPQHAAARPQRKVLDPANGQRLFAGVLPPGPKGQRGAWRANQVAKLDANRKGLVLDYVALNSSLTNYVLKGDSTYYFTGTVNLYGTTVIEGGTVIKYTNSYPIIQGPVDCRTDAYRPAFFVSKNDDTVGEIIPGSTGNPSTNQYAARRLDLSGNMNAMDLHDLRFRHGFHSIYLSSGGDVTVRNCQFSGCFAGVVSYATRVRLQNTLIHDGDYGIGGGSLTNIQGEQMTFHRLKYLISSGSVILTNALVISVTNQNFYTGAYVVSNASDTGYFQTVGSASHYLASGSTNRDSGTTNLNPTLLAALKKRTTYPPIVLSNNVTSDATLTAQAQRDTDTPDLGYHYDPLDFIASQIAVTNATLTLQTGTALGVYGASSGPGLVLLNGGKILSTGAPDTLNRIVRYNLVQEQATTNWSASSVGRSVSTVSPYGTNLLASEVHFRFTDFSMPANGNDHLYAGATNLTFTVRDCQFHGGQFTSVQPDVTLLNNLFDRVLFKLYANVHPFTALMRNATFFGGSVTVSNVAGGSWTIKDNLFDTTNLLQRGVITHNHNGYLTNSVRLTNNAANDVLLTLTNIAYELGPLGRFYLPTNLTSHSVLFNSGSQNATNAGLYHFTAVTNQTRELSTQVDLGFHSVAVNGTGLPLDTGDGDGLPDYFEDANGNGSVDSGETDWQSANDWGLRVFITRPRNGGNIP